MTSPNCDLCGTWGDRVECCGCDKHVCEDCREVGPDKKVRCAECHAERFPGLVGIRRTGPKTFLCIWWSGDVRRERVFVGSDGAIAFQKEAASLAIVEADRRQFVETANAASRGMLMRSRGYSSVELYQRMNAGAQGVIQRAMIGGVS
jgi:hypothetical protein